MSQHVPNLLHPIQVTVERLVRSDMLMDQDAREAVHGPRTTPTQTVTIPAQIKWRTKDEPQPQEAGERERSTGYILVRVIDMDSIMGAGERLKRGDRISKMGHMGDLDLYLEREEPVMHLQNLNGAAMVKYHFADKHPVRQRGDL